MNLSQSRDLIFTATIFITIGGKAMEGNSKTSHKQNINLNPKAHMCRYLHIYLIYNLKPFKTTKSYNKF